MFLFFGLRANAPNQILLYAVPHLMASYYASITSTVGCATRSSRRLRNYSEHFPGPGRAVRLPQPAPADLQGTSKSISRRKDSRRRSAPFYGMFLLAMGVSGGV
jgi:hypothetical protein